MTTQVGVEQRRARLGVRHGLAPGHRATDVVHAADRLIGLHASDPVTPFLAARARVDGMVPADLERALYDDETLTKHLCMRRTLFVVSGEVLPVVHAACTAELVPRERKRLAKLIEEGGVARDGSRWIRDAQRRVLAALDELGPSTGAELSRAVPKIRKKVGFGEGKQWGGEIGLSTRIYGQLAIEGRIRRGRPSSWTSSMHRWEHTDPPAEMEPAAAVAELVRRWLASFGPATEADVAWWTGLGVTKIRPALAAVGAVEVDLDEGTGYLLPDDLEPVPRPEPWAALLPALDPTAMGWKHRGWYLGEHREALFDRNGNIGPTIWCDGRIVGGWALHEGRIRHQLLEDVGGEASDQVDAEVAALESWLGEATFKPRFPTPLDRELRRTG